MMKKMIVVIVSVALIFFWLWISLYMKPEQRFLRYLNQVWKQDGMPREMRRQLLHEVNVQEWLEHQEAEDEQADN